MGHHGGVSRASESSPNPDPVVLPEFADELLRTAILVAEEAAQRVRMLRQEVFGQAFSGFAGTEGGNRSVADNAVESKTSDTDPVTVVDKASEALIRARLAEYRPHDAVLGEEQGGAPAADADGVTWVVDPIDGTVNFLYGLPAYSISVAAQIAGRSVAGVVVDVVNGIRYQAHAASPALAVLADETRVRLQANAVADPALALVATGFGYGSARRARQGALIAELLPRVRDIRRVGSATLDLCMVAAGRVDAHYEHGLNVWDWAAGALIAERAGAVVRMPAASVAGSAGEMALAAAPNLAAPLYSVLDEIGATAPIPD